MRLSDFWGVFYLLGDYMIGTVPPLSMRLFADPGKPRSAKSTEKGIEIAFTIKDVEVSAAGAIIQDKFEKNLAVYLMMFGTWNDFDQTSQIEKESVISLEYIVAPPDPATGQEFQMMGFLSEMLSKQFEFATMNPNGTVKRLTPQSEPGFLGLRIPKDYKGKVLRLWRFVLQPS